jgi:hypothetical protein
MAMGEPLKHGIMQLTNNKLSGYGASLRARRRLQRHGLEIQHGKTPAMAANLSGHQWTIQELFDSAI